VGTVFELYDFNGQVGGFTIQNAKLTGPFDPVIGTYGDVDVVDVRITNSIFDQSYAGAPIYLGPGEGSLTNIRIDGNTSTSSSDMFAGAIETDGWSGTATNILIEGNTLVVGGTLYSMVVFFDGTVEVSAIVLRDNHATAEGAFTSGILLEAADGTLSNFGMTGNTLVGDAQAGALELFQFSGDVSNGTIVGNNFDGGPGTASVESIGTLYNVFVEDGVDNTCDTDTYIEVRFSSMSGLGSCFVEGDGMQGFGSSGQFGQDPYGLGLSSTSDLLGTGDPAIVNPDGTGSDMGITGGPGGEDIDPVMLGL
jgi:hypothetical protein